MHEAAIEHKNGDGRPSAATLRVAAWETTRRCPLRCRHCRGAAEDRFYPNELSTQEGMRLVDALAAMSKPVLILTGGEPMARPDIYELARYGSDCGLRVVMAPCGPLLNPASVKLIKASGIQRISVSLDGATAATHDAFRGVPGAFESALAGLKCARADGVEFQVNTTVTRNNLNELPALLELAAGLGAAALDLFFLVPTGRGAALKDLEISPAEYERTLAWTARVAAGAPITVRTTCAPHFARFARQVSGPRHTAGCMAGRGFVFISHVGIIQPCGFLDLVCGDLRSQEFDLRKIYEQSEPLVRLRDVDRFHGKCGRCEYRQACGGCRARAFARDGNYLGEEPSCSYVPRVPR